MKKSKNRKLINKKVFSKKRGGSSYLSSLKSMTYNKLPSLSNVKSMTYNQISMQKVNMPPGPDFSDIFKQKNSYKQLFDLNNYDDEDSVMKKYLSNIQSQFDSVLSKEIGNNILPHVKKLFDLEMLRFQIRQGQSVPLPLSFFNPDCQIIFNYFYRPDVFFSLLKNNIYEFYKSISLDYPCIYLGGSDGHAIALYITPASYNALYFIIVNSGFGLENHHNRSQNPGYYCLWDTFLVNIKDKNTETIIKDLILIVSTFAYTLDLNNKPSVNSVLIKDLYKGLVLDEFLFEQSPIFPIATYNSRNSTELFFRNLYDYVSNNKDFQKIKTFEFLDIKKFNLFNTEFIKIKKDSEIYWSVSKNNDFLVENNSLFTQPQRAGTCTWFALYWALFLYFMKTYHIDNIIDYFLELDNKLKNDLLNYYKDDEKRLIITNKSTPDWANMNSIYSYICYNNMMEENYHDKILQLYFLEFNLQYSINNIYKLKYLPDTQYWNKNTGLFSKKSHLFFNKYIKYVEYFRKGDWYTTGNTITFEKELHKDLEFIFHNPYVTYYDVISWTLEETWGNILIIIFLYYLYNPQFNIDLNFDNTEEKVLWFRWDILENQTYVKLLRKEVRLYFSWCLKYAPPAIDIEYFDRLKSTIKEMDQGLRSYGYKIRASERSEETLKKQLADELGNEFDNVEERLRYVQAEIENQKTKVIDLSTKLSKLETELKELDYKIDIDNWVLRIDGYPLFKLLANFYDKDADNSLLDAIKNFMGNLKKPPFPNDKTPYTASSYWALKQDDLYRNNYTSKLRSDMINAARNNTKYFRIKSVQDIELLINSYYYYIDTFRYYDTFDLNLNKFKEICGFYIEGKLSRCQSYRKYLPSFIVNAPGVSELEILKKINYYEKLELEDFNMQNLDLFIDYLKLPIKSRETRSNSLSELINFYIPSIKCTIAPEDGINSLIFKDHEYSIGNYINWGNTVAFSYVNGCIDSINFNTFDRNSKIYNQFKGCLEKSNFCNASSTLVLRRGVMDKIDYSPSLNTEYEFFYYPKKSGKKYYFIKYDKLNEQFNKILVKFLYACNDKKDDKKDDIITRNYHLLFDPHIGFNQVDNILLIMLDLTRIEDKKDIENVANNSSYDALIFEIQLESTEVPKELIRTAENFKNDWDETQANLESRLNDIGISSVHKKQNPYSLDSGFNPELFIDMSDNKYAIKNIHLNGWEVIRNDCRNNYPFLCFIPSGCNFYILKKNNTYKTLILFEEMSSTSEKNFLFYNKSRDTSMIYNPVTFVLDVKIKNNLLIPDLEPAKQGNKEKWDDFTLFKYLYKVYGTPEILLWHLRNGNNNIFTENQILLGVNEDLRLMDYEKYEDLGNNLYQEEGSFSTFLRNNSSEYVHEKIDIKTETDTIISRYSNLNTFMHSVETNTLSDLDNDKFLKNIEIIIENLRESNMINDISNTSYFDEAIEKFKDETKFCKLECPNNPDMVGKLNNEIKLIIEELELLRNGYSNQINWKNVSFGILSIIVVNSEILLSIIYINTLINNLYTISKIIKKGCKEYDCRELIVLSNSLKISKILDREFKIRETIFQIFSGYIIRENQWQKYQEIVNNYENRLNPLEVHQFMMGKGKSSVITPLLILYFTSIGKNINIVLPKTLEPDANKDQYLLKNIMKLDFNICNDIDTKKKFLYETQWRRHRLNDIENSDAKKKTIKLKDIPDNVEFNKEYVNLYDEFDFLYDPIKSNFNFVPDQGKPFNDIDLVSFIFDCINMWKDDSKISDLQELANYKDNFKYKIVSEEIYSNLSNNFIKNMNYGMPLEDKLRYVIPYLRKDLPLENSSFNSIITTIMLTLTYFKENNYNLEHPDYVQILKSNNKILLGILGLDKEIVNELFRHRHSNKSIIKLNEYVEGSSDAVRKMFILQYFIDDIMPTLLITDRIYNCSFMDIIGNRYEQWQVGYTGTVNFNLPAYGEHETNVFKTVLKDYDEALNVYFALTGTYVTSQNKLLKFKKTSDSPLVNILKVVFERDNSYNVLIDAGAYLINESNQDIVTSISNVDGYQNRYMVFVNSNIDEKGILSNQKMVLHNNYLFSYKNEVYNTDELFIYYSQQNTIGVDIKQPAILKGLIIIDDWNTYTQVSQAIYRCRKLNIGQTIDILYIGNNEFDNSNESKIELYKMLIQNNINELKSKASLELTQNLKYCVRKYSDDYSETDIKPTFSINDNTEFEQNQHNPIDILRCMQRIKNNIHGLNIGPHNNLIFKFNNTMYETVIGCECISDGFPESNEKDYPWCEIDDACMLEKLEDKGNEMYSDNFIKNHKDINYSWNYINTIMDISPNDIDFINILLAKVNSFDYRELIDFTFKADIENVDYQEDIENTVEQEEDQEEDEVEDEDIELQINILGENALVDIDKYFRQHVWLPNNYVNDPFKYLMYLFTTGVDNLQVFMSLNIFNDDLKSIFLIKINENSIIIESNTIMFWYYDKCPIYTVTGVLVNFFKGADTYWEIPTELYIFANYKLHEDNVKFIYNNLSRDNPMWEPGSQKPISNSNQDSYIPETEVGFNNISFAILISILCKKEVINPKIYLLDHLIYILNDILIDLFKTKILEYERCNTHICNYVYLTALNNDFYVILNRPLKPLIFYEIENEVFEQRLANNSEKLNQIAGRNNIKLIKKFSRNLKNTKKLRKSKKN